MLFGIRLLGYLGEPDYLVRLAKLAEDVGFDFVWFPHDLFMANSWIMTTAAGMATDRRELVRLVRRAAQERNRAARGQSTDSSSDSAPVIAGRRA